MVEIEMCCFNFFWIIIMIQASAIINNTATVLYRLYTYIVFLLSMRNDFPYKINWFFKHLHVHKRCKASVKMYH